MSIEGTRKFRRHYSEINADVIGTDESHIHKDAVRHCGGRVERIRASLEQENGLIPEISCSSSIPTANSPRFNIPAAHAVLHKNMTPSNVSFASIPIDKCWIRKNPLHIYQSKWERDSIFRIGKPLIL